MLGSALFGTWNQQLRVGYIFITLTWQQFSKNCKTLEMTLAVISVVVSNGRAIEMQLRCELGGDQAKALSEHIVFSGSLCK